MDDTELAIRLLTKVQRLEAVLLEAARWIETLEEYEHFYTTVGRSALLDDIHKALRNEDEGQ